MKVLNWINLNWRGLNLKTNLDKKQIFRKLFFPEPVEVLKNKRKGVILTFARALLNSI